MARPRGPRFKVARALGVNVYNHPKALKRGVKVVRKQTEYGKQLTEKQKLKAYYDMMEKQFVRYVKQAMRSKGNSAELLVQRLECRLDNVVYRLGFASSLRHARQLVSHGHTEIDGKKVDRPSYFVKPEQVISLKEKTRSKEAFQERFADSPAPPVYFEVDKLNMTGKLTRLPLRDEVPIEIEDNLIIEYYSR